MTDEADRGNDTVAAADLLQPPAVRPPRRISRPLIKLKMPPLSPQIAYNTPGGLVTIPITPVTGLNSGYPVNVFQAYPNKAQEFMFKQFAGFKDFTMNTGKLGLSFGEKLAFWMYGKVSEYSKSNFTHILLFGLIILYCALGGCLLYLVEAESKQNQNLQNQNKDYEVGNKTYNVICDMIKDAKKCSLMKQQLLEFKNHIFDQYRIETKEWGILNSIYLCGTIFTTIGFGIGIFNLTTQYLAALNKVLYALQKM